MSLYLSGYLQNVGMAALFFTSNPLTPNSESSEPLGGDTSALSPHTTEMLGLNNSRHLCSPL